MLKQSDKDEKMSQPSTQNRSQQHQEQQQRRVAQLEQAQRSLLANAVRAKQRAMTASSSPSVAHQPTVSHPGIMQQQQQQQPQQQQRLHSHQPTAFETSAQQLPFFPQQQSPSQNTQGPPPPTGHPLLLPGNQQAELISQYLHRSIQERRQELERSMMRMKHQREQAKRHRQSSLSTDESILDERKPAAVDRKRTRHTGQSLSTQQQAQPRPTSNPKALIHDSCRLYPTTLSVVDSAIKVDPEGIRRRIKIDTPPAVAKTTPVLKAKQEGIFELPINVALQHNASMDVLQLLVQVGPDVLTEPDGPDQCCSLAHALCKKRTYDVIQLLVHANPDCCKVQDRHSNFPLHTACSVGGSLAVVKLIKSQYPEAAKAKNFNGQTPLDICQRNVLCSDAVIDFLQYTVFDGLEDKAIHLDFDDDEYFGSAG